MGFLEEAKSFIPGGPPALARFPSIGEQAPTHLLLDRGEAPCVLVFLRHVGCPLCEDSFRKAIELGPLYQNYNFIIVMHAEQAVINQYIAEVLMDIEVEYVPNNVKIVSDADRSMYGAFGIGTVPLAKMFDKGIIQRAEELSSQGINPRKTHGSRWQNNGGFAIDKDGVIRWAFLAERAADTADLKAAVAALVAHEKTTQSPTSSRNPTLGRQGSKPSSPIFNR